MFVFSSRLPSELHYGTYSYATLAQAQAAREQHVSDGRRVTDIAGPDNAAALLGEDLGN